MHRSLLTGGRYIYYTHMNTICVNKKLIVTLMVSTCTVSRVFFVLCSRAA